MVDVISGLLALITTLVLAVCMPSTAQCPSGWWLAEGVRTTGPHVGEFVCFAPSPRCCGEPDTECAAACPNAKRVTGRIHCTGGAHPIIVDEHTVGCQR